MKNDMQLELFDEYGPLRFRDRLALVSPAIALFLFVWFCLWAGN